MATWESLLPSVSLGSGCGLAWLVCVFDTGLPARTSIVFMNAGPAAPGVQMPSHKLAYPIFGLVHFSSAHRRSPPLRPTDAEADADTDGQVGFSAHASLSTVRIPANRTIKRYVLATGTNTLA